MNNSIRPTFIINILFYFVGRDVHVRIGVCGLCAAMPHILFCYVICIMVDHRLLNVDNHNDSLIKIRNNRSEHVGKPL